MSQTTPKNFIKREVWICALLILATAAVYWRVHDFDFVNLDDSDYVTHNPKVFRGLNWKSFNWAFTAFHSANWHPLTWLSHMLDCQLFGSKAGWHHLVNVLFHTANTLLLFGVLKRIAGAVWRSAFVAALFALHPLHVESVAWIAERKDVLSTFFFMLTLHAYARYSENFRIQNQKSKAFYICALVCFAFGLMSKPMLVTLPFVLLLLDYWPLGRFTNYDLPFTNFRSFSSLFIEKLPFLALSAGSCVVTFFAQKQGGSVISLNVVSPLYRAVNSIVCYELYLEKMFWPDRLAPYYPLEIYWPMWRFVLGIAVLVVFSLLVLWAGRRVRYLSVGWFWYLGTLVPVIGFVQVGTQAMADRYTYIPLIGIFILLTWGASDLLTRWRYSRIVLTFAGLSVLIALTTLTWTQVSYWRNSETLFRYTLRVTSRNWLAHQNLGSYLLHQRKYSEVIEHCQAALRIAPQYTPAHFLLGEALLSQNQFDEAIAHYAKAVELVPNHAEAHCSWGNALRCQGKDVEAEAHYLTSVRIKPDNAISHVYLGILYLDKGRLDEAIAHFRESLAINPDYVEAHHGLGNAFARQKKFAAATEQFRAAIKLQPDNAVALNDLAWILVTSDEPKTLNFSEAIRLAERACAHAAAGEQEMNCLDTLATAYARAGRFSDAATAAEKTLALARNAGKKALILDLERRIQMYRENVRH